MEKKSSDLEFFFLHPSRSRTTLVFSKTSWRTKEREKTERKRK